MNLYKLLHIESEVLYCDGSFSIYYSDLFYFIQYFFLKFGVFKIFCMLLLKSLLLIKAALI